jgi:hypothetical protein
MRIELTVTAVADRDPSCNLFTYTRTYTFPLSRGMLPTRIREHAQLHKEEFREAWPHRGTNCPTLIPIDVSVKMVDK